MPSNNVQHHAHYERHLRIKELHCLLHVDEERCPRIVDERDRMGCEFMESISRNILTMFINDNVLTIVKLKVLIAEWVKFKKKFR